MKKTVKQTAATLFAVALFVTGLVLSPAMSMTASAAAEVTFVQNTKMTLVDSGSANLNDVMFWKGQKVSFSVEVGKTSGNPTWEVLKDGEVTDDIIVSGSSQYSLTTNAKVVTQAFTISDVAEGDYVVVAHGTSGDKEYPLTVQDKMISTFFHSSTGDDTAMYDLWTGTTYNVYVVSKKGETVNPSSFGSSLVTMTKKQSNSTNIPYYGAGSEVHEYSVAIGDTIADKSTEEDSATLIATCGSDTQELRMFFKQSAKSFEIESITCADCESGAHNVTHFDKATKTICLDQNQEVDVRVVCKGSWVEEPNMDSDNANYLAKTLRPIMDNVNKAISEADIERDQVADTTTFTVRFKAKSSTQNYKQQFGKDLFAFISMGNGNSERYGVRIYAAGFVKNPVNYYIFNNKVQVAITSLNLREGDTGCLHDTVTIADPQEKVEYVYVSGDKSCFTINSKTGEYQANAVDGHVIYNAIIQETNSGKRGQTIVLDITVKKHDRPASISLVEGKSKEEAVEASPTKTLYVGDHDSVITYWVSEAEDDTHQGPFNLTYNWTLTGNSAVCEAKDSGKWATITPTKKGTVTLKVKANEDASIAASNITYNVFAPIKEITLKADNEEIIDNSLFEVEQRVITLQGIRDDEASVNEKLIWTTSDPEIITFVDKNGKNVNTATGNNCNIKTLKPGTAKIMVEADGFGSRSTAYNYVSIDVQARVPADAIVFTDENNDEITSYDENAPYEVTLVKEGYVNKKYDVSMIGYDELGSYTNDLFSVTSSDEKIAKVTYSAEGAPLNMITIEPVKAGLVAIKIKNESTDEVKDFWVRVRNDKSMVEATIAPIPNITYTGLAVVPNIVVTNAKGEELNVNIDYRVNYSPVSLVDAGTYVVTVTGIGKYTDDITTTFKIVPADIAKTDVKVNNGFELTYNGSEQTPSVSVQFNSRVVTNTNYSVTYSNNKSAGKGKITLKGKGNFKGSKTVNFTINPKDVNYVTSTLSYTYIPYTGSALKPSVKVVDVARGNKTLTKDKDYSVSYKNNTKVGTASVTVKGLGNYGGSKVLNFTIQKRTITLDDVTLSKVDYVYNGKTCKPTVTIKNGSVTLKKDKDYTIQFPADMKNIGVKTITINGIGNYAGLVSPQYYIEKKIDVKKPSVKSVKNSATKTMTVTMGKLNDVAGYEVTYSTSSSFTKATTNVATSEKPTVKITKLTKGKTYYVKCRAYKKTPLGRNAYSGYTTVKKVKISK